MPPLVQALNGQTFSYAASEVEDINEGRSGWALKDSNPKIDQYVTTSINCWATVYELIQHESFSNPNSIPDKFTLFYTGRFQAYDYFSQLGQPVALSEAQIGDVILVITERQLLRDAQVSNKGDIISSTPGSKMTMLEHAMTYIDEGLVFEKSNGGSADPFRFITLKQAVKGYQKEAPMRLQVRRVSGPLPPAAQVFGGTAYAVKDSWRKPIPARLQNMLLMSKELLFPHEGEYYNSWSQVVDVSVVRDNKTGRYKLGPDAYSHKTFDANANARKCERLL